MINLNSLIKDAFSTIEQTIPDAIIYGRLVKYDKVYDRDTAKYVSTEVDAQPVKCVFENSDEMFRTSENTNTIISKIHVFGLLPKPVDMFDELQLTTESGVETYKTEKLRKINVGESSVLHTFIITT